MTATYATFIAVFPEFANGATFPQDQFNFWIAQAYSQLNTRRLGSQLDLAAMLYTAHNLTLSAGSAAAAKAGQLPGQATGPVSSESVGPVSASYDVGAVADPRAGTWNMTSYGQRPWTLIKAHSLGPSYVPGARGPYTGTAYR